MSNCGPSGENCAKCYFLDSSEHENPGDSEPIGKCRRFPPQADIKHNMPASVASVYDDEWCGEFKSKESKP